MKLKTSFFNPGLAKSLFKRFWPLWLGWLVALLMLIPLQLSDSPKDMWLKYNQNYYMVQYCVVAVFLSIAAAVLAVMAVFSHLFNRKDCGLINSLPIRRDCAFFTSAITGLAMLLLGELLCYLATLAFFGSVPDFSTYYLNRGFLMIALATVAFYGIATLCAMFTGHVLAVPVLFVAVNLVACYIESLVRSAMGYLIYGYTYDKALFTFLSPLVQISDDVKVTPIYGPQGSDPTLVLSGMNTLAAYALVGVVLIFVALLFYRRRHMECAGDFIAVSWLRPVFKYLASICSALGLAYIIIEASLNNSVIGSKAAALCAVLLCIGAAVGFYAAQMLLDKSLKVFRTKAWGLLATCLVALIFVGVCEFDLTGYERYVPDEDEIQSVRIFRFTPETYVEASDAIETYRQLHQTIIDNKAHNESAAEGNGSLYSMTLVYKLKDGSSLVRMYSIDSAEDWLNSGTSELDLVQDFCALPSVKQTYTNTVSNNVGYLDYGSIDVAIKEGDSLSYPSINLQGDQLYRFVTECVIPDMVDSNLGRIWSFSGDEYYSQVTNVELYISFYSYKEFSLGMSLGVTMDATRTLEWLKENYDIEPFPLSDVTETYDYNSSSRFISYYWG
jgi:ABC-2 type transport system permease protein